MSNKKSTKRALLTSVLAMLLCLAMLVGTTFAWFTDSVTSANNKIQSGTLNIDLLVKDADGNYQSVKDTQEAIFDYDKWEPGYTEVRNVKVTTTGNLALKYTLRIVPQSATEDALKLAEVIDVYYANSDVTVENRDLSGLTKIGTLKDILEGVAGTVINDTLIPGDNTEDFATIALKMQESAGNDYQNLSVGNGFDLNVLATQYTYEADSFDDQYDANAAYPVSTADEFTTALSSGGIVAVNNDLGIANTFSPSSSETTVLNLEDAVITYSASGDNFGICDLKGNAELVINGNGTFTYDDEYLNSNDSLGYIFRLYDEAKLIINDGTFQAGLTCVQAGGNSQVEIYGGLFIADYSWGGTYWLLNLIDSSSATITVYGGTFVNYDPSNSATESPAANFVADGYTVVSEAQENGDIWYTVVPEE